MQKYSGGYRCRHIKNKEHKKFCTLYHLKEDNREESLFDSIMCANALKNTFIKYSGLPEGKVTHVVLGAAGALKLGSSLEKLGVQICSLESDGRLDSRVYYNTDVLCCHLGENRLILSKKQPSLDGMGFDTIISDSHFSSEYPFDVPLNAAVMKDLVVCNVKHTDKNILSFAENKGYAIVDVKQGYSKCSLLPITENAAITDDKGIYDALKRRNYDMLLIDKCVVCEGYECGFIGGAGGKLSKESVCFTGIFDNNEIKHTVESFIHMHGVRAVYLTNLPIFDVGSIIPVLQIQND